MILTKGTWALIKKINCDWNNRITYQSDTEQYGMVDYWSFPVSGLGDCEDFAIAKRRSLSSHGIESRFATCWVETGGYHAVLIVHTDLGDFVLDNRHDDVKAWDSLPYKWHKIEGENGKWYAIV